MKNSPRRIATISLPFLLTSCAVWDPYVKPDWTPQQSLACQPVESRARTNGEFAGGASGAVDCIDAWRGAWHEALGDHARFRTGQELLIGALSASALYDGITGAGNDNRIAALGIGSSLLYLNTTRRSPASKSAVYAAGIKAMSCLAVEARPLLLPSSELDRFKDAIQTQTPRLGRLAASIASLESRAGRTSQTTDARNTLNLMQMDLDKAAKLSRDVGQAGLIIEAEIGRIVAEVNEQLRRSEPDPSTLLTQLGSLKLLAGGFAQGYLVEPAQADGATRHALGTDKDQAGTQTLSASRTSVDCDANTNDLGTALYCAHDGAQRLQPHLSALAAATVATTQVQSCSEQAARGLPPTIRLQPDVNRWEMRAGSTMSFLVRSDGGIPDVRLINAPADVLAEPKIDASRGVLVVTLTAGIKPSASDAQLVVSAANGDSRIVAIAVTAAN